MLLFAKVTVFEGIHRDEESLEFRNKVGEYMKGLRETGKLIAGWALCDGRGGYFLLEVDKSDELLYLFTPLVLDHMHIEIHPVTEFENLIPVFQKFAK